ncbi:MAG: hypothetical protein Q7K35_01630, partial [bacterium]|nr:hypothetical protein [bacterium]
MKKIFYNKSLIKLIFILTLVLLFFNGSFSFGASPDAIGFRVIPNSNHLSPLRWYQENIKLKGSPQVLNVDGYEAVRDGRTVYVNAANIDLGAVPQKLYTNIYIISYNQQAENATLDIFGQILEHWKFTTNLSQEGVCSRTMDKTCLYTSECPSGEYCLSKKATVIRDTKRLADLADIKTVLDSYQKEHSGKYPSLSAGSYLPGKSISKWPSWRGTLSKDLGAVMPFDPINKLGKCRADCCAANNCVAGSVEKSSCNYNQETCWDEKNKKFADRTPPTIDFDLPVDSRAYVYIASSTGASFTLCANMESVYVGTADGSCLGNTLANNPPVIITNSLLPGRSGAKYRGFVQARDPDGDILSWSISLTGTDWTDWVGEPILKNTGVNNQIEIYAD